MSIKATEKREYSQTSHLPLVILTNDSGLTLRYFSNGASYDMRCGEILINQILGNYLEPGLAQVSVRVLPDHKGAPQLLPITGPGSTSDFSYQETADSLPGVSSPNVSASLLRWSGRRKELSYVAELQLHETLPAWFWRITLENLGSADILIDVTAAQDLGLASPWFVRLNEAYACHYIDNTVLAHPELGHILCCRQNLTQGEGNPWVMMGCFDGAEGFLTDGFDFFGTRYKGTSHPESLKHRSLENRIRQYEFTYPALKSKELRVMPLEKREVSFFGLYDNNHAEASSLKDLRRIKTLGRPRKTKGTFRPGISHRNAANLFTTAIPFPAENLSENDCLELFPGEHRHQEKKGRKLLSFFYNNSAHVVLREKELLVERPHGQILRSGNTILPDDNILSTTVFAAGIFGSQTTIGNTAYNKILSGNRNALFLIKSIGTRIFVTDASTGKLYLLELPSAFETGLGYARWVYKHSDHIIEVFVWTSSHDPTCYITAKSSKKVTFTFSYNIVLGSGEGENRGTITLHHETGGAALTPERSGHLNQHYPSARFCILAKTPKDVAEIGNDMLLFEDRKGRNLPFLLLRTRPCKTFSAALTGSLSGISNMETFLQEKRASWELFNKNASQAYPVDSIPTFESSSRASETARLNEVIPWFVHNGTIHLSAPRGLEQYTAAAWGTRDVCQGPVELLLPLRRFAEVRKIILTLYSHQFLETGDWPQWFMFDRYHKIQAQDSHGDVIIWPLKAICDYIEASNDISILKAKVPYTNIEDKSYTRSRHTILDHIDRQIDAFQKACVKGTALLKFGHGDWEDTLQPADALWRDILVSSWSVELLYQTLRRWSIISDRAGLRNATESAKDFSSRIRSDFGRYLLRDGIVTGLLLMSKPGKFLLHPSDRLTGAHYRLIPMTRGILSEIFTPEEARRHVDLIHQHLLFPDGVRLTNAPMTYHGGISKYFKRAETSAFFGREVGMMYVHAHLRYIEAMAKMGMAEEAWRGLAVANPVLLSSVVKNAEPRQSNMYFSSTDASFLTRTEASREFDQIRAGTVGLKGGWRLYSSGPGLFVKQLFSECIGIRDYFESIVFDPVLPINLGTFSVIMEYEKKKLKILITPFCRRTAGTVPRIAVNGETMDHAIEIPNPYRVGGAGIDKEKFLKLLKSKKTNIVEVQP